MISSASSKRPITWSSGSPKAWACLPACPEPSPKTNRPPLISSSVSTALAVIAGIAMQGGQDPGADLHPRGRRGHGAGHRDALPPAVDRSVGRAPQQLVRDPDGVEARSPRLGSRARGSRPSAGSSRPSKTSSIGSTRPISIDRTVPPGLSQQTGVYPSGSGADPFRGAVGASARLPRRYHGPRVTTPSSPDLFQVQLSTGGS